MRVEVAYKLLYGGRLFVKVLGRWYMRSRRGNAKLKDVTKRLGFLLDTRLTEEGLDL